MWNWNDDDSMHSRTPPVRRGADDPVEGLLTVAASIVVVIFALAVILAVCGLLE